MGGVWAQEASAAPGTGRNSAPAAVRVREDAGADQDCGTGLRTRGNLERFKGKKGLGLLMAGR